TYRHGVDLSGQVWSGGMVHWQKRALSAAELRRTAPRSIVRRGDTDLATSLPIPTAVPFIGGVRTNPGQQSRLVTPLTTPSPLAVNTCVIVLGYLSLSPQSCVYLF